MGYDAHDDFERELTRMGRQARYATTAVLVVYCAAVVTAIWVAYRLVTHFL
jgi:hypothetical protein